MRSIGRVPVWGWRLFMSQATPREAKRFNVDPIQNLDYHHDLDYAGDGSRAHSLDIISPRDTNEPLPVYLYFHGGGWTSGDKHPLTKYCASQAQAGMVVVNANYRRVGPLFHMRHLMQDANAALEWTRRNAARFGGDPDRIVLGGDSAGGQIAALLAASITQPDLAAHYGIRPTVPATALRGIVQHCSAVDFSVVFERGFIMSLQFVRMLLPERLHGTALERAARFLSPIEWLDAGFPPAFVTTSEADFFYRANLNFIERLRLHGIRVDTVIYDRSSRNTRHTWQQDARYPESQAVYARLQQFVASVTSAASGVRQ